jgi:hypothetical protein
MHFPLSTRDSRDSHSNAEFGSELIFFVLFAIILSVLLLFVPVLAEFPRGDSRESHLRHQAELFVENDAESCFRATFTHEESPRVKNARQCVFTPLLIPLFFHH